MGVQSPPNGRYSARITGIATRQGGHIERSQLQQLGLTEDAIKHLVARGYLIRALRGVYAVGHVPTASLARAHAPLLAVGHRSALVGWSATNAYNHAARWVEPLTVITPLKANPAGVNTLHTTQLRLSDIRTVHGLRTVSPALAVLHVAPDLSSKRLIRLIDDFRINQNLTHAELETIVHRFRRHGAALRRALQHLQPEPTARPGNRSGRPTRSGTTCPRTR